MNRLTILSRLPHYFHPARLRTCWLGAARFALLVLLCSSASLLGQGSLTPPGPPAPTMKRLDEVEPRTNLQAIPLPPGVTTDASNHFIIDQPGSYYLSANISVTKPNGIIIVAEGVTLDLNGFQVSRSAGAGGDGILILFSGDRATVSNGSIKGFSNGINSSFSASACAFRQLTVSACTNYGILTGVGAVLDSCRAYQNSGNAGIRANNGSTLSNCIAVNNSAESGIESGLAATLINCSATENTGVYGISVSSGSTLTNCAAYNNSSSGAASAGIQASSGSTISHCSAFGNTSGAAGSPTTGMGFDILSGSTIQNCTASFNRGDGIRMSENCIARENHCHSNSSGGVDGAGIHASGAAGGHRIESNNVSDNARGLHVEGTGSLIIRNSARGNGTNYVIAADNDYGTIVDATAVAAAAVNGNSSASTFTTAPNAWANFAH